MSIDTDDLDATCADEARTAWLSHEGGCPCTGCVDERDYVRLYRPPAQRAKGSWLKEIAIWLLAIGSIWLVIYALGSK